MRGKEATLQSLEEGKIARTVDDTGPEKVEVGVSFDEMRAAQKTLLYTEVIFSQVSLDDFVFLSEWFFDPLAGPSLEEGPHDCPSMPILSPSKARTANRRWRRRRSDPVWGSFLRQWPLLKLQLHCPGWFHGIPKSTSKRENSLQISPLFSFLFALALTHATLFVFPTDGQFRVMGWKVDD
jgi:hypothetical protein